MPRSKIAYQYKVGKEGVRDGAWTISKHDPDHMNTVLETYTVQLNGFEEKDVWCNCPGFRMQKYDKRMHKHVRLVHEHVGIDAPTESTWTLEKKTNTPILVRFSAS